MRSVALSLALCLVAACGEDEPERNAPPIGSGGGGGGPVGGGSVATTTNATDDGTGGSGTDSDLPASTGADTGTTGAPYPVLRGSFVDGGGGFAPVFNCQVKFYGVGAINPSTGQETMEEVFHAAFAIDAYPQSFEIMSDQLAGVVEMGDTGFVTAECDIDGDGLMNDNAGAYYPGLPLTQITLPASSISLPVMTL